MYSGDELYGDEITSGLSDRHHYPTITGPRTVGAIVCHGCGSKVQVVYQYSNSNRAIGIVDHKVWGTDNRCSGAGVGLIWDGKWSGGSGYQSKSVQWEISLAFELSARD